MGCDIHLFAEAKSNQSFLEKVIFWEKPKWQSIEKWEIDPDYDEFRMTIPYKKEFYNGGRNYNLFCALCGVRSYQFNGNPAFITLPRGIPDDSCQEIKDYVASWGSDGHSHNYNTLKELKEFNWSDYGDTVKYFLDEVIPKMEKVSVCDEEVRIVYFFDN